MPPIIPPTAALPEDSPGAELAYLLIFVPPHGLILRPVLLEVNRLDLDGRTVVQHVNFRTES